MGAQTVYVILSVSFFWFFFTSFCILATWHFLTKKKKMEKKLQEAEVIRRGEHLKMKENLEKGRGGEEARSVSIERDESFEKDVIKNDKKMEEKCMEWKSGAIDIAKGASTSNSSA